MKKYTKQQILNILKYELSKTELEKLCNSLEEGYYTFDKTSDIHMFKERYVYIKDIYHDNKDDIELIVESKELLNIGYSKAGFINRYETNYENYNFNKCDFLRKETIIQSENKKHVLLNKVCNKINGMISNVYELVFYVPTNY